MDEQSSLRCAEPGWVLCAMNDPTGRRGIWYRIPSHTRFARESGQIELCAGREGDDEYVKFVVGQTLTVADVRALLGALERGAHMVREAGLDKPVDSNAPDE